MTFDISNFSHSNTTKKASKSIKRGRVHKRTTSSVSVSSFSSSGSSSTGLSFSPVSSPKTRKQSLSTQKLPRSSQPIKNTASEIERLESELNFTYDSLANVNVMFDSLRNAYSTCKPEIEKNKTETRLGAMEKELLAAYDDVGLQVIHLERQLVKLEKRLLEVRAEQQQEQQKQQKQQKQQQVINIKPIEVQQCEPTICEQEIDQKLYLATPPPCAYDCPQLSPSQPKAQAELIDSWTTPIELSYPVFSSNEDLYSKHPLYVPSCSESPYYSPLPSYSYAPTSFWGDYIPTWSSNANIIYAPSTL
ncbi:hypothetical protein J3Q64DRAFT_1694543 [Phycomyces blakesleeanus]|uniref:Uncharacterized protein n=2 Tax=Phycomyces blakesleeanus TaxID=4837 RepID=A0A162V508_PHYB8|nr:hypothetical protein PHYBLDRAFT_140013 [Phycomyces blakesleeanus NRRL 1555(-)]OAD80003.1 hypothetical protein PHYBLDRAFT_140013 [Phycomyces blakesleeanus NRRL 1555(-)]|eukprot:XP_018298043.1 hypothetical protein PHYBLDRAFT_140013 [Phycomyces blakesleeanus NRRL 1555(-)]